MNALTSKELKVLNGISRVRDSEVELGTIIATLIGSLEESGTPVKEISPSFTETSLDIKNPTSATPTPATAAVDKIVKEATKKLKK